MARSATRCRSRCTITMAHPARHRENRPETLPSGSPKMGADQAHTGLWSPLDESWGQVNPALDDLIVLVCAAERRRIKEAEEVRRQAEDRARLAEQAAQAAAEAQRKAEQAVRDEEIKAQRKAERDARYAARKARR